MFELSWSFGCIKEKEDYKGGILSLDQPKKVKLKYFLRIGSGSGFNPWYVIDTFIVTFKEE